MSVRLAPEAAVQPGSLFLRSDNSKRQKGHAGKEQRGACPLPGLSLCQMFATLRTNFLTSQSCRTKIEIENAFCPGSTQIKGRTEMRKERTLIRGDGESVGYTFFFQIVNDGGRRACCVKVDASNIQEASALFRQNWSVIESMARDGIDRSGIGEGVITLVMP